MRLDRPAVMIERPPFDAASHERVTEAVEAAFKGIEVIEMHNAHIRYRILPQDGMRLSDMFRCVRT